MLTDATIKAIKADKAKSVKKADGGGLFIHAMPDGGSKLWRLAYRFGGKQKLISGGAYPAVGLAAARRWRDAAREQLAAGIDPSAARKDAVRAAKVAAGDSFEAVGRDWHASRANELTPRYGAIVMRRLETDVFPWLGTKPIRDVDGPMLLEVIRRIETRGALDVAKRVRAYAGRIIRYAIAEGRRTAGDPSRDILDAQKKARPVVHRPRVTAAQMPLFWQRFHLDTCDPMTLNALRLVIGTMTRTNEIRFATWSEFEELDGKKPIWLVPASRMKMKRDHVIPLTPQVVALLKVIKKRAGDSRWLFPMPGSRTGTISENRLLDALKRQGWGGEIGHATVHGFRGLASTFLNEATRIDDRGMRVRMWDADWIELQLAHHSGGTRAAYNFAQHLESRRAMLEYWSDWLDEQEAVARMMASVIG